MYRKELRAPILLLALSLVTAGTTQTINLQHIGTYATGIFDEGASEVVDHDPLTQRVFSTNANDNSVDILDISDPTTPVLFNSIDIDPYGGGVNSVVVLDGAIAVAVEADPKQDPGSIVFFGTDGTYLNQVTVGALPDMVTTTPDKQTVLVANEGEPSEDYLVDPIGTVSIIDISGGIAGLTAADVTTLDFSGYSEAIVPGARVFGPGASFAQDMEPEHVAVSTDGTTAWVVCQENNVVASIDLGSNSFISVVALGTKDHSLPGNGFDASNRDDAINIMSWPTQGFYMPDGMDAYSVGGADYVIYANEGDSRDYDGYSEEERVEDLTLDTIVFPVGDPLQLEERLGRLKTTNANGDTDGDGDHDIIYSYGTRSFTIRDAAGNVVYDSGDLFEQITAAAIPADFNSNNDENGSFDNRSDDKGPEPEAVEIAEIDGEFYAFIGLERVGGIMVFNVSDPANVQFEQYVNNRDFSGDIEAGTGGDSGVETLKFISASNSPTGEPLLVSGNEVSGTVSFFRIEVPGCVATGDIIRHRFPWFWGSQSSMLLGSFEAPQNDGNFYTARMQAQLCVPTSGDYTFYIASNDQSVLRLSVDDDPDNGQPIAWVPFRTAPQQWTKYGTQQSAPLYLEGGEQYYIEAAHLEVWGADHLAVGWQVDGSPIEVIPGAHLSAMPELRHGGEQDMDWVPAEWKSIMDDAVRVRVSPNPTDGQVELIYHSIQEELTELTITNSLGQVMHTTTFGGNRGTNAQRLDLTDLAPGAYFVSLRSESIAVTERVVIR